MDYLHRQVTINITKEIEADEDIVDLVQYFNNLPQTLTLFSCQGHFGKNGMFKESAPYVLFITNDEDVINYLKFICGKMHKRVNFDIFIDNNISKRYQIWWNRDKYRKEFEQLIKEKSFEDYLDKNISQ